MERVKADDIWQLTGNGQILAYGNGGTVREAERSTVYVVHEIATVAAAKKREGVFELAVNNKRVCGGPARCERAGSRLLVVGEGWRVEAGK